MGSAAGVKARLGRVSLMVFGQVRLLPEVFAANLAGEGLFPGVRAHVHVDAVLVLEALVANVAVVEQATLLFRLLARPPMVLSHFGNMAGSGC